MYADHGIATRRYDDFVAFIRTTLQKTLVEIDQWISANGTPRKGEPVVWTGVGMYHWVEHPDDFLLTFKDIQPETTTERQTESELDGTGERWSGSPRSK